MTPGNILERPRTLRKSGTVPNFTSRNYYKSAAEAKIYYNTENIKSLEYTDMPYHTTMYSKRPPLYYRDPRPTLHNNALGSLIYECDLWPFLVIRCNNELPIII